MACDVVVAYEAQVDIQQIIMYLEGVLKSPQAARGFLDDVRAAISQIGQTPEWYPFCRDERLGDKGYRRALLGHYVLLYIVVDNTAVVERVFHGLQDYARFV